MPPEENLNRDDEVDPTEPVHGPDSSGRRPTLQLRSRDHEILQYIARYRCVTYELISRRFSTNGKVWNESLVRRRLAQLASAGLVTTDRTLDFCIVTLTRDGAKMASCPWWDGMDTVRLGNVHHVLAVAEIGTEFENGGELVVSAREVRNARRGNPSPRMTEVSTYGLRPIANGGLFAIGVKAGVAKDGSSRLHVPDLVLARRYDPRYPDAPQSIAVEVEISPKPPVEYQRALIAFSKAPNIRAAIFYTPFTEIHNRIMRAAETTKTSYLVTVHKWKPGIRIFEGDRSWLP